MTNYGKELPGTDGILSLNVVCFLCGAKGHTKARCPSLGQLPSINVKSKKFDLVLGIPEYWTEEQHMRVKEALKKRELSLEIKKLAAQNLKLKGKKKKKEKSKKKKKWSLSETSDDSSNSSDSASSSSEEERTKKRNKKRKQDKKDHISRQEYNLLLDKLKSNNNNQSNNNNNNTSNRAMKFEPIDVEEERTNKKRKVINEAVEINDDTKEKITTWLRSLAAEKQDLGEDVSQKKLFAVVESSLSTFLKIAVLDSPHQTRDRASLVNDLKRYLGLTVNNDSMTANYRAIVKEIIEAAYI